MRIIKLLHRIIMFLALIVLLSCGNSGSEPSQFTEKELAEMTLSSLKKVHDYPLYVMTYQGNYGFEEFIKTGQRTALNVGNIPEYTWGCTCFSGLKNENCRILGRNFNWPEQGIPLLLFTDPSERFASVSEVDLGFFGYTRDSLPDLQDNRENLLYTPWLPFDGLNEKGVAIGMMAIPHAVSPYDPEKISIAAGSEFSNIIQYNLYDE